MKHTVVFEVKMYAGPKMILFLLSMELWVLWLIYNTSSYFLAAGRAHQKCGVSDLLLGRPNWPESEEDLWLVIIPQYFIQWLLLMSEKGLKSVCLGLFFLFFFLISVVVVSWVITSFLPP